MKAATLAVGTEVTDGQIIDRNSAWISHRLVNSGIEVIEHRAVADDRADITRALSELSDRVDILFVTGGLGPTSDDFTRDLLSEVYRKPLEYDPGSWKHIEDRLGERGIKAKEIQRQQCYFPHGARVLTNPVGTANAFSFTSQWPLRAEERSADKQITVYALPGPPAEIAAVWDLNINREIEALTPSDSRERLFIYRCLGRGESDLAELTEAAIQGSGLRVGYRAHVPYVEIKLWVRDLAKSRSVLTRVEETLRPWLVNRDDEDATDAILADLESGRDVYVRDEATQGYLQERLSSRMRERKISGGGLSVQTIWTPRATPHEESESDALMVYPDPSQSFWVVEVRRRGRARRLEVPLTFNYKITSDRGRKFIAEKALLFYGAEDS